VYPVLLKMLVRTLPWLLLILPVITAVAQQGAVNGEWRYYGGDAGHSKYSPLDQINRDNVQRLEVAWTWTSVDQRIRADNAIIRERGSFRSYAYEVTPLMVNGTLYTTTSLGQIAAINPVSGETLWSFDPVLYADGRASVARKNN
jgi:quinoprotein glucose dehydrogenase